MKWKQLTIYTSEAVRWQHRPLYIELVERARKEGISGAFVTRGIEGYGAHHSIQTVNILALSADLPIEIRIIDKEEAITNFLSVVEEMVSGGIVTLEDINVVNHPKS